MSSSFVLKGLLDRNVFDDFKVRLSTTGKDPKNPEYLQGLKQGENDKKSGEDKNYGISLPSLSDYPHSVRFLEGEEGMVFHAETCAKFHRRSANKTDFPRITFGIDYSSKVRFHEVKPIESRFTLHRLRDVDSFLNPGGLAVV